MSAEQWWMNSGRTVFSQLIAHLAHSEFQKCVARYYGDRRHRSLSCWDQYLAMAFAQLTYRESLRDIEACLRSMGGKLRPKIGVLTRATKARYERILKGVGWGMAG